MGNTYVHVMNKSREGKAQFHALIALWKIAAVATQIIIFLKHLMAFYKFMVFSKIKALNQFTFRK